MAKKSSFIPDLLPSNTIVEVVKLDLKGNFVGKKDMEYGQWRQMTKQVGFIYRAYQKKFSQYHLK